MFERTYTIRGIAPLIMHNQRLSDPLNEWTRQVAEISKKKGKTDEDLRELGRREWFGGIYLNENDVPIIPEANIERMLRDAAAKSKKGKHVLAALVVLEPAVLQYEGPKSMQKLWDTGKFVLRASCKVGQQRVIRSRPIFRQWSLTFTVVYDENVLNTAEVDSFVELAGRLIGLCDWRPKHGRFEVESVT